MNLLTAVATATLFFAPTSTASAISEDSAAKWDTFLSNWKNEDPQAAASLSVTSSRSSAATQYKEQCLVQFDVPDGLSTTSNYMLMDQPSGLCMDFASCIYQDCLWPFEDTVPFDGFSLDMSPLEAEETLHEDKMNLPAAVLHAQSSPDVVRAIKFAAKHKLGISVKVAGHSYFGASTVNDSLLVKMTKFTKYAASGNHLVECEEILKNSDTSSTAGGLLATNTAIYMACNLAKDRKKQAVLRVGGGEIFDEAYRAVSMDWNSQPTNINKYHLVGGGAGTVSAAGGWLASGGLSGTTGMRMYGMGIDQVLHMEMVLPNGEHVRFGPSEWEAVDGYMYPKTTKVVGYCNTKPLEREESKWEWKQCDDEINFNDLWFAARGGGGGSFGILTSVYYQLHDLPGNLDLITTNPAIFAAQNIVLSDDMKYAITFVYIEFVLRYFYNPSSLGVSEKDSDYCGSAMTASFDPFNTQFGLGDSNIICYGPAGAAMISAWQEFISQDKQVTTLQESGLPPEGLSALPSFLGKSVTLSSFGLLIVLLSGDLVPTGRMGDRPEPSVVPRFAAIPEYTDAKHTHFPLDALVNKIEELVPLLTEEALESPISGAFYALGGKIPIADDQVNALSPTRRTGGLLKAVLDDATREKYLKVFYGNADGTPVAGTEFPGSSCHNHALVYEMGPLKTDWSTPCPSSWPQTEREEKCISQNEAAWGTKNLARLEAIKTAIDPDALFVCTSGIGFDKDLSQRSEDGETEDPKSSAFNSHVTMLAFATLVSVVVCGMV